MECSSCGVSESTTRLFDVISGEGIVKLCDVCLSGDSVPLKRPTGLMPGVEKKQTTYERLSAMAGIKDHEEHKQNVFGNAKKEELKEQEVTLRDLIDEKFDKFVKEEVKKREDLVDNFHWVIMRARRAKKMSVGQLARDIGEAERVVKNAEQGILPEGYDVIVKLERVLGISLLVPEVKDMLGRQPKRLTFDRIVAKDVTIADLSELKEDEEVDFNKPKKTPYWKGFMSRLMSRREKPEGEIVVKEVGRGEKTDSELGLDEGPNQEDLQKEMEAEFDNSKREEQAAEYDETSLQMTTRFPGREEAKKEEVVEKEAFIEKKNDPEREMSQEEIDDLIFGRK